MKRRPSWGDKNRVDVAQYLSRRQVSPSEFKTDADALAESVATKILVMIHDWNVTDESGRRAPIVAEALKALDAEDGEYLWAEARKRFDGVDTTPLANNSEPTSATESSSPTPEPSESPA